jgi:hypothetical protein
MSVTRRQFLLSTAGAAAGAIVPSFYYRALEFFEQHESPLLIPPERVTQDLVVADINDYPELCLGDPWAEPGELTWREYFDRYEPGGLEDYAELYRLPPSEFEQPMDYDASCDLWLMRHGPSAQAYRLLEPLDLGPALRGPEAVGGLDFIEEMNMGGSNWLVVSPQNEVTLSLLQQRLNDLGTGLRIVV